MINDQLREEVQKKYKNQKIPCISVLDPVMHGLSNYFGVSIRGQPGRQHALDVEYYHRIEAMNYVISHDDEQSARDLKNVDVVLVGVSRTSKPPTSMYLANQCGISTANVPIVPDCSLSKELFTLDGPLVVGLINSVERLFQLRRHLLQMIKEDAETADVDLEQVKREVADAHQMFMRRGWPVIDVTRRSIEETAAAILQL